MSEDFKLLAYPLIQTILGILRLHYSPRFFPLRLNLIVLLNRISRETGCFVPIGNYILEMIDSPLFTKAYKRRDKEKEPQGADDYVGKAAESFRYGSVPVVIKLKDSDLKDFQSVYQLFDACVDALIEHVCLCYKGFGFGELVFTLVYSLKKLCKRIVDRDLNELLRNRTERLSELMSFSKHNEGRKVEVSEEVDKERTYIKSSVLKELKRIKKKRDDFTSAKKAQQTGEFIDV